MRRLDIPARRRKSFKRLFYAQVFFGKVRETGRVTQLFARDFPTVYEAVCDLKRKDYTQMAYLLQAHESKLMIDLIARRILAELPGAFVGTIHDSIMTTPDRAEAVRCDHGRGVRAVRPQSDDPAGVLPIGLRPLAYGLGPRGRRLARGGGHRPGPPQAASWFAWRLALSCPASSGVLTDMGTILRVATVNILNDLSRWDERRALLARGLDALSPDLIALQEVTDPLGTSTAHWLAGELGGYSVHVCPKTGWGRRREGIAVLSRLPVEGHEVLDLAQPAADGPVRPGPGRGTPRRARQRPLPLAPRRPCGQGPPGRSGSSTG